MTNVTIIKQEHEKYTGLTLLFEGCAVQMKPDFVGEIILQFPASANLRSRTMRFDFVSSVLYCDELLWSESSYPYFKDVNGKNGVFRVEGSSYLERIEKYYPDHKHYVYFDADFNWHITARGIEEID